MLAGAGSTRDALTLTGSVSHADGITWKISVSSNTSAVVSFSTKSILMENPRKSKICPTVSSDFNWPLTIWIIWIVMKLCEKQKEMKCKCEGRNAKLLNPFHIMKLFFSSSCNVDVKPHKAIFPPAFRLFVSSHAIMLLKIIIPMLIFFPFSENFIWLIPKCWKDLINYWSYLVKALRSRFWRFGFEHFK